MTNFLIATWEGGGSVMPMLTVAKKLADRGHRVRVMSDRCNRPEAEAAGAAFIPWTRAPSRPDRSRDSDTFRDWEAETPQEQIRLVLERYGHQVQMLTEARVGEVVYEDEYQVVAEP